MNEPADMDHTQQNIQTLTRQLRLYFSRELASSNITPSELMILYELYEKDGLSQDEIAGLVSVDKAAAARTIQSLENKNLVIRKPGQRNYKSKEVFLTAQATKLEPEVRRIRQKWVDYVRQDMSSAQYELFIRQLGQMARRSQELNQK